MPIKLVVLAVGFLSAFYIPIGNQLYIPELAFAILLPALLLPSRADTRELSFTRLACALWLFGIIISVVVNRSPIDATVTSLVSCMMLLLSVVGCYRLCRDHFAFRDLFAGIATGSLVAAIIQPAYFFAEAPWKFGLGLPITLGAVVVSCYFERRSSRVVLLTIAGLLNVLGDYRSLALIAIATAVIELFPVSKGKATRVGFHLFRVIAIVGLIALGVSRLYTWLASSGNLGQQATIRLQLQGGGDPLLMLLGGRYEIFFSLPAALRSPIIGYGTDPTLAVAALAQSRAAIGRVGLQDIAENLNLNGGIPTHSFGMSMWITAGALGLVAAAWIAYLGVRLLVNAQSTSALRPLMTFVAILTLWNLAFSPFGGSTRFFIAASTAWAIYSIKTITRRPVAVGKNW